MYLKKSGSSSVNDYYRNVIKAENIPEIDVQAHIIPEDNLFFWQLWLI